MIYLLQLQLSGEELHSVNERDGMVGMGSGMSMNNDTPSPSTARSIRLERVVQALAHSQEELRRRTGHTGFPNAGYPPHRFVFFFWRCLVGLFYFNTKQL